LMVTSALAAAATAADTKPPNPPYIQADYRLNGGVRCELALRITMSTDNSTPQNQIRYQVLSNGVPIPGQLLLATTSGVGSTPTCSLPPPRRGSRSRRSTWPATTRSRALPVPPGGCSPGPAELAATCPILHPAGRGAPLRARQPPRRAAPRQGSAGPVTGARMRRSQAGL
jgi:hypothetical protein